MKKHLLLLPALCLSAFAMAADVQPKAIIDLSDSTNVWNLPTSYTADTAEYTYKGQTIKMYYGTAQDGYKLTTVKASKTTPAYSYLIFGKKNCKIELPAFSFRVGKIVAYGTTSAGEKVETNVFVGDQAVSTKQVGAKLPDQIPTFIIDTAYRAPGNKYAIKVISSHNMQITKIEIYEEVQGAPENPVFSPKSGTYTSAQYISISSPTDGASIQYSFDNLNFSPYASPILIQQDTTIYAKAVKNSIESDVVSATYRIVATQGQGTKENPFTIADLTLLNNPGDTAWVEGYILGCAKDKGRLTDVDTINTNVLLGDNLTDSIGAPVSLSKKDDKAAIGLKDNPKNKGKKLLVKGALVSYFSTTGIKNISEYEIIGGTSFLELDDAKPSHARKILQNGQLFLLINDEKYTTSGTKL